MREENWQSVKEIFLAALECETDEERARFLAETCQNDSALRDEIESLLASHKQAETFIEEPAFAGIISPPLNGSPVVEKRIGHYRILREIGRGGMGAVYLAERADGEFEQRVAVKIMRQTFADSELARHFRRERQILAALNHPNIARLLDGGVTASGEPYFVMEYVEGVAIREYSEDRKLTIKERLELFLGVCSAVAYAHRNLIVHRDIKPSNILVTSDGTPKLLDFGLAKILDTSLEKQNLTQTATGFRAMTPAYASPEQLRGETITTASDIYSLGVVLYELLTGERPYNFKTNSFNEIIRVVCETLPERPSSFVLSPSLPEKNAAHPNKRRTMDEGQRTKPQALRGDLDNIVLKALNKEPERRYASVEQMAEDIRRHLNGLPISARPDTFSYRAGKFIKRNKISVAAALLILLSLVVGFSVAIWQAALARQERRISELERARAERRFNDLRSLANSFIFEIHDQIENLPGSTPAREALVSRALKYLDSLAQEASGDVSLQRELAAAYERIGNVQGNPNQANLGDSKGAFESFRKAQAIREKLLTHEPENLIYQKESAANYALLGETSWWLSDTTGALNFHEKARRLWENLLAADPKNSEIALRLAGNRMAIGQVHFWNGFTQKALESYQPALAALEKLNAEQPENVEILRTLGDCHTQIGETWSWDGDPAKAMTHFEKALRILEPLQKSHPNDAKLRRALYLAYLKKGETQADSSYVEALPTYKRALLINEVAVASDPRNMQARRDLSISYNKIGDALTNLKRFPEALAQYDKALEIQANLAAENSKNAELRRDLANTYNRVGDTQAKVGNLIAALQNYEKALKIRETLVEEDQQDSVRQRDVAISCRNIANTRVKLADLSESASQKLERLRTAREWYNRSRNIYLDLKERGAFRETEARDLENLERELQKCETILAKS